MKWKKIVIYDRGIYQRYQWISDKNEMYTIDVMVGRSTGTVSVYQDGYKGWILGTPKYFRGISPINTFVAECKLKLEHGIITGRKPFPT